MANDSHLGPYRILRLINEGGQGSVYLGYDRRLNRPVAIKIHPLPVDRAGRKHLLREARLVASVESPRVVQIYDVIESSHHIALIMEYVSGCDLEELLTKVEPCLSSILTVAVGVTGALAAARQQHIVHGDLKAKNILIAASGQLKLTDFGIARREGGGISGGSEAGSFSCVSPEQYRGEPLDVRSDLFALGCLLYRMLTGVQPFMRAGRLDEQSLLYQTPTPVEQLAREQEPLPEGLARLIASLLQKNPARRPSNTHGVRQQLREVAKCLPLPVVNTLLEEARPFFRAESAEDLPPLIPADLNRAGRSRMQPAAVEKPRWPRPGMRALILLPLVAGTLALLAGAGLMASRQAPIHIEEPVLALDANLVWPSHLSSQWLVDQVKLVLVAQMGPVVVTGSVGSTGLRRDSEAASREAPAARIRIALHCVAHMCLLDLSRQEAGLHYSQQAMLTADMPEPQWQSIVQTTTLRLYHETEGIRLASLEDQAN